jgi:hypothetical protein
MNHLLKYLKWGVVMLLFASLSLSGCSNREPITEKLFVGKWKSSKLTTPIYLYENGEWEIKSDAGAVLQYGIWEFKNNNIVWNFKVDGYVGRDPNPVLSATPREFQLRESDGKTTTFSKLD